MNATDYAEEMKRRGKDGTIYVQGTRDLRAASKAVTQTPGLALAIYPTVDVHAGRLYWEA